MLRIIKYYYRIYVNDKTITQLFLNLRSIQMGGEKRNLSVRYQPDI